MFTSCYKTLSDPRRNNFITQHLEIRRLLSKRPRKTKMICFMMRYKTSNIEYYDIQYAAERNI